MKLAVIGGGSTYTPELIDGIIKRSSRLPITNIYLLDITNERLEIVAKFAQRMVKAAGKDIQIIFGTDLEAALKGADFVISQFRVGTQKARHKDELLGRKYGLIGQETVGVGGFAKALRTIPVAMHLAQKVRQIAPQATFLNFTNPAGLITQCLTSNFPDLRIIGLCNVPWNTRIEISNALKTDVDKVDFDYVGLNHLSWVRGVSVDGIDVSTAAIKAFRNLTIDKAKPGDSPAWTQGSVDLLDAIPNYYLLYYYETDSWIEYQKHHDTRASEVIKIEAELIEKFRDINLVVKPEELMKRGGAYYSDSAAELMSDIYNNAGTTHIVNTRNDGAIPGIHEDAIVEISSTITKDGAKARSTTALRPDIDALVRSVKDFELLTIDAALNGSEESALRALISNPLGPDLRDARELWSDLKKDNAGMLGIFN
jgi:6-phospho-beta-glucosidase